jgi:hypothetical protein
MGFLGEGQAADVHLAVRRIEMSWLLGATSELDRSPSFILDMMSYGER